MGTGEGKSLTCTCAVYLNALTGARRHRRRRRRRRRRASRAQQRHQQRHQRRVPGGGHSFAAAFTSHRWCAAGKGAHLVTVNDYLARRDAEAMGQERQPVGSAVHAVWGPRPMRLPGGSRAQAAATHPGAPPQQRGGFPWLRKLGSARPWLRPARGYGRRV